MSELPSGTVTFLFTDVEGSTTTGTPQLTQDGYVGIDVHRAARIAAETGALDASTAGVLGVGPIACDTEPQRGVALVAACVSIVREVGGHPGRFEGGLREAALERARAALGDTAFDTAVAAGRALSLDDAIALARASV